MEVTQAAGLNALTPVPIFSEMSARYVAQGQTHLRDTAGLVPEHRN